MGKPGRTRSRPWLPTSKVCAALGISRWTLARARKNNQLRKGYHWKVVNPTAAKLRYLWHLERLEKWQQEVTYEEN